MKKLILVIVALAIQVGTTEFTKCCPNGKILNIHTKNCIDGAININENLIMNVTLVTVTKKVHEDQTYHFHQDQEAVNFKEIHMESEYQCNQTLRYNFEPIIVNNNSNYLIIDHHRSHVFNDTEVCLDIALNTKTLEAALVAQACLPCSQSEPCVNYCCPGGQVSKGGVCVEGHFITNFLGERKHNKESLGLHCKNLLVYPKEFWHLNTEGEMVVDGEVYDVSEYCVDGEDGGEPELLLCAKDDMKVDYEHLVKMVFMCLSVASVLLMIFFHITIEELWTDPFTKLKIPFYASLVISFLLIIISSLIDFTGTSSCVAIALCIQYFSLSIFFWLTCMSFDVWLLFKKYEKQLKNKDFNDDKRRRGIKLLYWASILGPFVICVLTGALQLSDSPESSSYIHPSIGVSCMIGQYLPRFIYFHLIIFSLLCVNFAFFCFFLYEQYHHSTKQLRSFRILVELLILMGMTWFAEVAAFLIRWQLPTFWDHPLLTIMTSINWLYGVIILFLFCCKRNNRNHIRQILKRKEGDTQIVGILKTQLSED